MQASILRRLILELACEEGLRIFFVDKILKPLSQAYFIPTF